MKWEIGLWPLSTPCLAAGRTTQLELLRHLRTFVDVSSAHPPPATLVLAPHNDIAYPLGNEQARGPHSVSSLIARRWRPLPPRLNPNSMQD